MDNEKPDMQKPEVSSRKYEAHFLLGTTQRKWKFLEKLTLLSSLEKQEGANS